MAKLNEEMVVIKISKLLKDSEEIVAMLDPEMQAKALQYLQSKS